MRDGYYNKFGVRIGRTEWGQLMQDQEYKRVDMTTLPDGKVVSTVWIGIDHNWMDGPPLIFETMVFPEDSWSELQTKRYETLSDAVEGHRQTVKEWTKKITALI